MQVGLIALTLLNACVCVCLHVHYLEDHEHNSLQKIGVTEMYENVHSIEKFKDGVDTRGRVQDRRDEWTHTHTASNTYIPVRVHSHSFSTGPPVAQLQRSLTHLATTFTTDLYDTCVALHIMTQLPITCLGSLTSTQHNELHDSISHDGPFYVSYARQPYCIIAV